MSASRSLPNFGTACCVIEGGKAVKDWYKLPLPLALGPRHKLPLGLGPRPLCLSRCRFPWFRIAFLALYVLVIKLSEMLWNYLLLRHM